MNEYHGLHFPVFLLVFFWFFWAALSWAFCWVARSLFTSFFFSVAFLAIVAFFLSLIYLIASSASAFLSSVLAALSFLMASKVTPSMALSILKAFFFLSLFWSDCFIFLLSLLQAVVHLNLWALSFLRLFYYVPDSEDAVSSGKIKRGSAVLSDEPDTFSWVDFPFTENAEFSFDHHWFLWWEWLIINNIKLIFIIFTIDFK